MTEQRVRELLTDVADAVPPPDLAARAWQRSVRVRRRRVAATAVVAVGTVVAVIGVVGVLNDGSGTMPRPDGDQETRIADRPLQAALPRPADTHIDGGPAWVGPTIEEEARLPATSSAVLPPSIDLASSSRATDKPGRSVAAFAASDSENQLKAVMLVSHDGDVSRLDTPGLDIVHNPDNGNDTVLPLNISSLSPDGRKLVLAQNHEVVVYDLVSGARLDLPTQNEESYNVGWTPDSSEIQLPNGVMNPHTLKITTPQGPTQADSSDPNGPTDIWPPRINGELTAQARSEQSVPALDSRLGTDPVLIRVWGSRSATLALPSDTGDLGPRSRVVGWLGPDEVAFQSQDFGSYRVLDWDTHTGEVRVVTNVTLPDSWNDGVTASWADVSH
jgi:hypothetical protein